MAEKQLIGPYVLAALTFALGALLLFGYHQLNPVEVQVEKEVIKTVEVPVEKLVYVNATSEPAEASASTDYLAMAKAELEDEFGDDEDFLTCGGHEYDSDEWSISRVEEHTVTQTKKDDVTVTFTGKFVFADNSDEHDCKETREVKVFWDHEEDHADVDWS